MGRLNHHWVRAGLAALAVGTALFGLGIAAYAVHVCASATALIDSASRIHTLADAEREVAKWRERLGKEFWMESDNPGRSVNYYARVRTLRIAHLHLVKSSEVMTRVTVSNGKLLCVTVFVQTPEAPVAIQEWFNENRSNLFYLSSIKGAPPTARVQFSSSLPDVERGKAFAVRTRCLVLPFGCNSAEDVLPVIRDM